MCHPRLQQGPQGRPGPLVRGCPPAARGSPHWAPVPERHLSLTARSRSPAVSVLTPQHPGKPLRAMGASPHSTGLGRAPCKPGRWHERSWALPGSCCSHPCPWSRAPNSSGATWGAFHICHPVPGLQIRFLFPSQGLGRAPVASGGLVLSARVLLNWSQWREPGSHPTSLGPTHGAVSAGRGVPGWSRRLPVDSCF